MSEEEGWRDTNVGAIGSDEDTAARKEAALTEPAWEGCGQEAGLKIWRVEHFTLVDVDPDTYGKFYEGDSYIVLHTEQVEDKLSRTIYFWLGAQTSIDEQGTAAYKTVELDDYFDGEPTQVREVMGSESQAFKDLFGVEVEYLEGGIDSGFKHVVPESYDPKLYIARKFKGKLTVVHAPLRKDIITEFDCYVLDSESKIYVYDGSSSSPFEKNAANMKAESIESTRADGIPSTRDIDDDFWVILGA